MEVTNNKRFVLFLLLCVNGFIQGLVLGVYEKQLDNDGVHFTEAAAAFDRTVSGKLSEMLSV